MALKFLNKKGWHTGSLRNIENVWKAEQKKEAEERKSEELRKQIHQEREQLEFRKLQEQAGLIPKQERLDFLYESGLGVGKPSTNSEEYLLGKPLEEPKENNVLQQVATQPGSLFVEEKISANDQWRKIRSDPLLLIKQQELAARERIKNNPLKMEALRKEVERKKKEKEERKRLKKEEKKKKKALKKMKKKDNDDEDEVSDDGRDRKRARHDSPVSDSENPRKDDTKGDSRDRSPRKRTRHDSPDPDGKDDMKRDSRDRSPGRRTRHDSPDPDGKDDMKRDSRDRSPRRRTRHDSPDSDGSPRQRSPRRSSSPRRHEDRARGRSPRRSEDRRDRSPRRSLSPRRREGRSDRTEDRRDRSPGRYGNRRRDSSPRRYEDRRRDSSPRRYEDRRRNLSPKRHDQDEKQDNSRAFGRPPLPARKKVKLTEEEIAARVKEMQQDAELHEEQRWQRLKTASEKDATEEQRNAVKLSKNFLDEANRSIYGTQDNGNASVADTVHRRSHYRDKITDANAFRRT